MEALFLIISLVILIRILKKGYKNSGQEKQKAIQTTTIKVKLPDTEKQKALQYRQLQRERKEKEYNRKENERTEKEHINKEIALSNNIQYDNSIQELRKQFDYYESIEYNSKLPDKIRIAANNKKIAIDKKIMDLNNKIIKNQLYIK